MDTVRVCVDCQRGFTMTEGETRFFEQRAMQLPKRCLPCRRIRRTIAQQQRQQQQAEPPPAPSGGAAS